MKVLHGLLRTVTAVALVAWFTWTALTVAFSNLRAAELRLSLTGAYVLVVCGALVFVRP